jgi:hypothetical protein
MGLLWIINPKGHLETVGCSGNDDFAAGWLCCRQQNQTRLPQLVCSGRAHPKMQYSNSSSTLIMLLSMSQHRTHGFIVVIEQDIFFPKKRAIDAESLDRSTTPY